MRSRKVLVLLTFCLAAMTAVFASPDANIGTWKLNEAKSKIAPGVVKNNTVTYTAEGDKVKCVVDGVDSSGKAFRSEWTGKFDGKDYAVTGDPTSDMRSIKKVSAKKYELTTKKGGKTGVTGTVEISADGKTRTLTTSGADAKGKKFTSTSVFEKQ